MVKSEAEVVPAEALREVLTLYFRDKRSIRAFQGSPDCSLVLLLLSLQQRGCHLSCVCLRFWVIKTDFNGPWCCNQRERCTKPSLHEQSHVGLAQRHSLPPRSWG